MTLPNFERYPDGLVPVVVQDNNTQAVLMLGYMNRSAYEQTLSLGQAVFFSRSRQQLWHKGATSGNTLSVCCIRCDCDADCLLLKVVPAGPVCHTGADTCFEPTNEPASFLYALERVIADRKQAQESTSYTASLFRKGINAIAQKVGEEAVELVIEAKDNAPERFRNEAADLLFHYLVLLQARNCSLEDVESVLRDRHRQ